MRGTGVQASVRSGIAPLTFTPPLLRTPKPKGIKRRHVSPLTELVQASEGVPEGTVRWTTRVCDADGTRLRGLPTMRHLPDRLVPLSLTVYNIVSLILRLSAFGIP